MTSPGGKGASVFWRGCAWTNTAPKKTSWRLNTTKPVTASEGDVLYVVCRNVDDKTVVKMMRRSVPHWPFGDRKGGFARSSQASRPAARPGRERALSRRSRPAV